VVKVLQLSLTFKDSEDLSNEDIRAYMEFMNGISIRVILEHNGIFCQELVLYHFSLNEYDNVIINHLFYSSKAIVMSLQIYKLKLTIVNMITYDRCPICVAHLFCLHILCL